MKIAGIIAEYNPFHIGHIYHIAQTKEAGATHIVAVMSGSTVQRGEFAILRKETRTRMALEHGADLVICLPTPWSCARAQDFSRAAIHLVNSLGCVDILSFGSECGDMDLLKRAALGLRDGGVVNEMKGRIGEGAAFAVARQQALAQVDFMASQCLRTPNDTLNVEYVSVLKEIGAGIRPLAIPRVRGEGYKSASELRIIIEKGDFDHNNLQNIYKPSAYEPLREELSRGLFAENRQMETAMLARLRTMSEAEFVQLPDISEGMERLLARAVREGRNYQEILSIAVGKRYPAARIRRIMFHALLRISKKNFTALPGYIQILGFNKNGRAILHRMKTSAMLPIVHRYADAKTLDSHGTQLYEAECRATDLQALAMKNALPCGTEERRKMVVI